VRGRSLRAARQETQAARMPRLTRVVLRVRWPVLAFWLAVLVAGGWSSFRLSGLLSNTFTVPGTDSERARAILQQHFGDRDEGRFVVVFKTRRPVTEEMRAHFLADLQSAAGTVPGGVPTGLEQAGATVLYGTIESTLTLTKAKP